VTVIEVNRPNRQLRRKRQGKSDATDAESAARAVLGGEATTIPKSHDGNVEALRGLRNTRRSAMKMRTQTANQLHALVITAPDELRVTLNGLKLAQQIVTCARFRVSTKLSPENGIRTALRSLARRYQALTNELGELDRAISSYCEAINPALLGAPGIGTETASALLVAAGDNPHRMRNDASFAALCGASPLEASSGKTTRHRLNRGGNRDANYALWRIALTRLGTDTKTIEYSARRRNEGKSHREIMRCLKRYIAREVFHLITSPTTVPKGEQLRLDRIAAGITLKQAASQLSTFATRLSDLERSITHNTDLALRYQHWLKTSS
jgi:transposase